MQIKNRFNDLFFISPPQIVLIASWIKRTFRLPNKTSFRKTINGHISKQCSAIDKIYRSGAGLIFLKLPGWQQILKHSKDSTKNYLNWR